MPKLNELALSYAQWRAHKIEEALKIACERIEVVGSIRRERLLVHDIDLVVIPHGKWIKGKKEQEPMPGANHWFDIPRLIRDLNGEIINNGPKIITAIVGDFQVDINCAREDNWGILYLLKTGPLEFNIQLCERAKKLGKQLKMYSGIWEGDKRFPAETEEDIFKALELEFVEPTERDAAAARLRSGMMV